MSLTLINIPAIMRHHKWHNGARLMEIWFSRKAAVAPAYGPPDTATISMDRWVLTYRRARDVYETLMKERIWANEPARREIAAMLRRKGLLGGGRQAFGALDDPVPRQDPDRVNYRKVEFAASDLDDLAMALGNFTLNVAVAGLVEPAGPPGRHRVTITAVGVYVRDSYDFEGDQPLGFWDDSDNSVSTWNPLAGTYVSNASFRDWRSTTGMGGDFRVFSDVKVTRLDKPDVFVA